MSKKIERCIAAAKGGEIGSLLLKNGKIVNVFSGEIVEGNVLITEDTIAGVGDYEAASEVVDMEGQYLLPSFVDAHVHIESSHLTPVGFSKAALLKGTGTIIADPHEIANVMGEEGLAYMMENAKKTPLDIFYMIPSAVPSTTMETAGAVLDSEAITALLKKYPEALGLGEVMNVPGVLLRDYDLMAKLDAAQGRHLDGHFPLGSGKALQAYAAAGIDSDHESVTLEEAKEKLRAGMTVFMREGSSAQNLAALIPLVNDDNHTSFCFCADDISAADLVAEGDILRCVKKAVALGLSPIRAIEIATINPCRHYGLKRRGAIAPGYLADFIAVRDLQDFEITAVYKKGREMAPVKGQKFFTLGEIKVPDYGELLFPQPEYEKYARVIKAFPSELITEELIVPVSELPQRKDIAKLLVMERYGKNGNLGWGLIEGFGTFSVTIAQTIAHDSHNILVLGHEEKDMEFAIKALADQGGGVVITEGERVLASMPLPIGGLMTTASPEEVTAWEKTIKKVKEERGILLPAPIMTLSFMALPVIPKLKVTDKGLFDGEKFDFVPIYFDM